MKRPLSRLIEGGEERHETIPGAIVPQVLTAAALLLVALWIVAAIWPKSSTDQIDMICLCESAEE